MKFSSNNMCPCGSLKKYKKCCKPFHDRITFPTTALELMKSRYSAFSVCNPEYIIFTTHEENPDFTSNIEQWKKSIVSFSRNTKFEKLEILDFVDTEEESFVTFKVTLFQDNEDISFTERSRFLKVNNIWQYVDGEFSK